MTVPRPNDSTPPGTSPTDLEAARRDLETAVRRGPCDAETLGRLAATCAQLGDWNAAETHWRAVLRFRPRAAVAQTGLAIALRESGQAAAAIEAFTEAARTHPNEAAVHYNLGTCLLGADRAAEAVAAFRAALALERAYPEARFNLALALLKSGAFSVGALAYEARWQAEWKGKERPFTGPRWNGRALPPKAKLLLWGEQGIGDEIMFAGLLEAAVRAAAGPVALECAPRLVPLFARSFPSIEVYPRTNPPDPTLDPDSLQCPTGTLPALLWTSAPAAPPPYLRADPTAVARQRAWLASLGPGRKVGIAWRGGHPAANRPRFIPPAAWSTLFRPGHDLVPVCLQHAPIPAELARVESELGRTLPRAPEVDPLVDLDAFASLLAALDAVVAVDNSTVHLAGALGVPTIVLLGPESDWRWGVEGTPCPWYRSVTRLRQTTPGDWLGPMEAAAELLRA